MPSTPRVAIVHDWLTGFAGGEQVILAIHEMYPDAPIYTSIWNPLKTPQFRAARVIPSYLMKIPGILKFGQIAAPLMPQAFEAFDLKSYDVIVSSGAFAKGVISQPGQKHLAYTYTPMRYAWRLGGDDRNKGLLQSYVAHGLRIWDVVSAQRPDVLLTTSKTVADRVNKIYRREAEVLYPPVETSKFTLSEEEREDYFLIVGRLIQYKRVDLAVAACKLTKKPLKVVGEGPELQKLKKMAEDAPWIEFLGRISDDDLKKVYARARAFLFPAEEDFGIVPVEAMCTGCPVIAYGKGGATETVLDGVTGVHFHEQTAESLAEAIKNFDPKRFEPKIIRKHALTFDKELFKKRVKELIEG